MLFTAKSPTHRVCTHEAGTDLPRTKSPSHGVCTHEAGKDQQRTKPNATTSVISIHLIKHHANKSIMLLQIALKAACATSSLFRVKAESPELYSGASCTSFIAAAFFCNFAPGGLRGVRLSN